MLLIRKKSSKGVTSFSVFRSTIKSIQLDRHYLVSIFHKLLILKLCCNTKKPISTLICINAMTSDQEFSLSCSCLL